MSEYKTPISEASFFFGGYCPRLGVFPCAAPAAWLLTPIRQDRLPRPSPTKAFRMTRFVLALRPGAPVSEAVSPFADDDAS